LKWKPFACRHRRGTSLGFHVEMQTAENVAAGMSPEEARLAALR
jgi:hypothetical protein